LSVRERVLHLAILAMAVAVLTSNALDAPASASHRSGIHIDSVHTGGISETFCAREIDGAGWYTAMQRAKDAIYVSSWDARAWDANHAQWKLWFIGQDSNDCPNLPPDVYANIRIEFELHWENYENCGSASCSIVFLEGPYGGTFGHTEYSKARAKMYSRYMTGASNPPCCASFYLHQINHETGHAIGLADGNGTCSPTSIMHSGDYGCPGTGWPSRPTTADITTAVNVANNQ
jgi:hypothetical protein